MDHTSIWIYVLLDQSAFLYVCDIGPRPMNTERLIQKKFNFIRNIRPDSHFQLLFEHLTSVCFFAKDIHGTLFVANKAHVYHLGKTNELEVIGRKDSDFFPTSMYEKYRKDDLRVMESQSPLLNIVELFPNAQGIPDWYITNKIPLFSLDNQVMGVMGSVEHYETSKQVSLSDKRLLKMFKYIQHHFTENIAINNLASECGLSLRQFERKFKEQLRITPRELIIKMRIQLACDKLQNPKNELSEIAYTCGFYDQSALTRQFKKHMGITPSQYRKHYY